MVAPVTPQQRRTTLSGIAVSATATLLLWWLLWRFLPEPAGADPLRVALQCSAVAALLTLVAGVEAVAHERLVTAAIDPLAGVETQRMRVNFRYLSNTLEQYVVSPRGCSRCRSTQARKSSSSSPSSGLSRDGHSGSATTRARCCAALARRGCCRA